MTSMKQEGAAITAVYDLSDDWRCPRCASPIGRLDALGFTLSIGEEIICRTCAKLTAPLWLSELVDGLDQLDRALMVAPDHAQPALRIAIAQIAMDWAEALAASFGADQ